MALRRVDRQGLEPCNADPVFLTSCLPVCILSMRTGSVHQNRHLLLYI
nr:MAG TPA: hypothetical protein [Caudoviricetes sp.]